MQTMRAISIKFTVILTVFALAALAIPAGAPGAGAEDDPVAMEIRVEPETTGPGQKVQVTLQLTPKSGYKINKYPQISLKVPEMDGVVSATSGSVGSKTPPPPEKMDDNYFKTVDPLVVSLELDPGLKAGRYEIAAKLKYFYCVKASGYCAPMRQDISIPIRVK